MMFLKCNFLQICLYDMARCDSNLFWSNFCWDPVYTLPCGADKVHSCLFFISVIPGWRSSGSGDSNVVTTDLRIIPAQCAVVGKHSQYNESLTTRRVIPGDESLQAGYKQDTKLGFIVKAIYTLAHSLHHMQEELCGDTSKGVCDKMKPFNGKLYRVKIYF